MRCIHVRTRAIALSSVLVVAFFPVHVWASFSDLAWHRYEDSIMFLSARDVVKGYPDGTFWPDRAITRAEMVKIIFEAAQVDLEEVGTHCFRDVADERYTPYICYAKQEKIIQGYGDGTFKPEQSVTFAEWLKIALNTFDHSIREGDGHRRYVPFVEFAHNNNLFSKYAFFPDQLMTRGQMSYLVHQLVLEAEGDRRFTWKRDASSQGCGTTPPRSAPTSVRVEGVQRNFLVALPDGYDEDHSYDLIIAFHGRTNPNTMVRSYYKIEKEAGDEAIVIYPSGLPEEWPTRNRSDGGDPSNDLRDFTLFDEIVRTYTEQYCIDEDEIYVIGHSLGAWFTNTLGCARGDVIRGIGSVGGSITRNECTGPVAALLMHHPDDNLAWYAGGVAARDHLLSANGCGPTTRPHPTDDDAHCVEYTDCLEWAPVVRCPHTESYDNRGVYYPHTRPTFAGETIWEFWEKLP